MPFLPLTVVFLEWPQHGCVFPALYASGAWDRTVEQGQHLQARIAGQALSWGRIPSSQFYGAQKEEGGLAAPKPELPDGLCAKGWGLGRGRGEAGELLCRQ